LRSLFVKRLLFTAKRRIYPKLLHFFSASASAKRLLLALAMIIATMAGKKSHVRAEAFSSP